MHPFVGNYNLETNIATTTLKNLDDYFAGTPLENEICYRCLGSDGVTPCLSDLLAKPIIAVAEGFIEDHPDFPCIDLAVFAQHGFIGGHVYNSREHRREVLRFDKLDKLTDFSPTIPVIMQFILRHVDAFARTE